MLIRYKTFDILADEEDRDKILKYFWTVQKLNGEYVAVARESYERTLLLHRYVTTTDRAYIVDAIDGNHLNCVKSNLRIQTRSAKSHNSRSIHNATGFRGVSKETPKSKKFRVQIAGNTVGGFLTVEEAAKEYDRLARILYGTAAVTNFDTEGNRLIQMPQ